MKRIVTWNLPATVYFPAAMAMIIAGYAIVASTNRYAPGNRAEDNWVSHGLDWDEDRFSPLDQITRNNVDKLGLAFSVDLPGETALEATPLAIDGVLYFSGSHGKVYAIDGRTGREIWQYDVQAGRHMKPDTPRMYGVNRGVAYWNGMIFVATKDCRMIALDAKTGKLRWATSFLAPGTIATSTGAPRAFNGKVIIGNSGAEFGARGYVTTFDAKTGKILWRFFTVPGNPETDRDETTQLAAHSWSGEWWHYGGGGTVWNGITYDRDMNTIYIGVGNAGPYDYPGRLDGQKDNLFISSVVAVDADTGKYKWHYQYNPLEVWDWKACSEMILADLIISGVRRKVLMQAPSNGFFYVIDRSNGKLISAAQIGKQTWAYRIDHKSGRPVERSGIRYETGETIIYPGIVGAHDWQSASYNSRTGLVYIPYQQMGAKFSRSEFDRSLVRKFSSSFASTGLGVSVEHYLDPHDPRDGKGSLLAWDPVQQRLRWRVDYPVFWNGGTVTTAGNLVFHGTQEGKFIGYDATTGQRLWQFDAGLGIISAPISYAVRGTQYIAVLVGWGGAAGEGGDVFDSGWKYGVHPRRLLVFRLGGNRQLPPAPPPDFSLDPIDVPELKLDPQAVEGGALLYAMSCGYCHGANAIALGSAPDLRESGAASDLETIKMVVRDGALQEHGMPKLAHLSDEQLNSVYQFIRYRARTSKVIYPRE